MDTKEIGKRLANLRGSRSQSEVAQAIGISASALGMYEQGRRIPRDEVKIRLADFYHTKVAKIFYP